MKENLQAQEGAAGLPSRWCRRHGAIYYRVRDGEIPLWGKRWYRLGRTLDEAMEAYFSKLNEIADDGGAKTVSACSARQIVKQSSTVQGPVVYFLIHDGAIVYVGKSNSVLARLDSHRGKTFDSMATIACSEEDVHLVEAAYIGKFKPKYNVQTKGPGAADAYFM